MSYRLSKVHPLSYICHCSVGCNIESDCVMTEPECISTKEWWLPSGKKHHVNIILLSRALTGRLHINTLSPRQNDRHFPDYIFTCIFLNGNVWISIKIPVKFVPKGPINNIPALFPIMAWRRPGDKPLSETMMVTLLTHIWVIRPQWVKSCWWISVGTLSALLGPLCGESIHQSNGFEPDLWCH